MEPYSLDHELRDLIKLLNYFYCKHVYREANYPVDMLSKHSHMIDSTEQYYTYHQLPYDAIGYYMLDKVGMINFRQKNLKRINQPP